MRSHKILFIDYAVGIGAMPDTSNGTAKEIREDLDKLIKQVKELDATVNDTVQGLAQRVTALETRVAELKTK